MTQPIAVILAGCGRFDGSETKEAVLTLLALDTIGAPWVAYAPDKPQKDVINHHTGEPMTESRNCLVEAARIPHQGVKPLSTLKLDTVSGLLFPGGFGAAKNLCNFANDATISDVDPDISALIHAAQEKSLPAGFICIAPVLIAKLYPRGVKMTIGNDPQTAEAVSALGADHVAASERECVIDEGHRVASTPAWMVAEKLDAAYEGILATVKQIWSWANDRSS